MKAHVSRLEFRAKLKSDATIAVPRDVAAALRPGQTVLVSIDPRRRRESGGFHSDEEVDRIALMQAESADAVRKCLDAQGSLSRNPDFAHRLQAGRTGRGG
ncbi:MAG TPA: hypothetical protein VJO14_00425 [Bacteroidota bacterium]|nr:hypothetical protein [Bacteroidota bacterium]